MSTRYLLPTRGDEEVKKVERNGEEEIINQFTKNNYPINLNLRGADMICIFITQIRTKLIVGERSRHMHFSSLSISNGIS